MNKKFTASILFLLLGLICFSCTKEKLYSDALGPEQALESFRLHEGFTIELFASEPHVMDPVSMVFDEKGNIYVVEMPDYPYKPKEGEAKGRIKLLIDEDNDGKIDATKIFADKLSEATSLLPWKDGLLVTAAPYIYYLKDTDGDFKADQKEILFSGFFENNSEAQITNLRFCVDNWIYAANHGQAGEVAYSRKPEAKPLSMQGGDFRFRLDKDTFELTTGPAQFGQAIDDWGNRFITQNTLHIRHAVIPKRYLERNPYLPNSTAVLNISDHDLRMFQDTPPPYWRAERTRRRQQQYDEQGLDRVEYAEDHFTGASGGTVYHGDAFPEEYYGNIFTGDVAGNLVHRDVLIPLDDSPTFVAQRDTSEKEKEFLSSTDPWFRPANFTIGPDGYLYVIDMYRQHIETPVSIPDDLKEDMDFLNGMDKGRIYRIKPVNAESKPKIIPNLREMDSHKLANLLTHPNQWWRLQAQRLLLERQDISIVPKVLAMFRQHHDPRVRLHALYLLEGLDKLDSEIVKQAMMDKHPELRVHGLILSERYPEMLPSMIACLNDSSVRVAFQASLSLGNFNDTEAVHALVKVLSEKGEDLWFKTAVLSSVAGSSYEFIQLLSEEENFFQTDELWKLSFMEDIAFVIGARGKDEEILVYLNWLEAKDEIWQQNGVSGIVKGLHNNDDEILEEKVKNIAASPEMKTEDAIAKLKEHFNRAI